MDDRDSQIERLERMVRERDEYIARLRHDIAALERSMTWKAVRAWTMVVDRIIPRGTRIRSLYDHTISAGQTFINETLPAFAFARMHRRIILESADDHLGKFAREYPSVDVLVINHEETRTGAPRIALSVAKALRDSGKATAIVSLAAGTASDDFEHEFPAILRPSLAFPAIHDEQQRAALVLQHVKPRAVYVSSLTSLPYARAAKAAHIPTIFHVHELEIAFDRYLSESDRADFAQCADDFIVPTRRVRSILVDQLGCDTDRVHVISEFIDNADIKRLTSEVARAEVNAEIGGDPTWPIIVCVGTFNYRKGADIFVTVAETLRARGVRARFAWLGGKHPRKDPVSIDLRTREHSISFLHERPNPFPFVSAATLFLLPSREDPQPLAALEAAALGVPVVCFKDAGGTAESLGEACLAVAGFEASALADAVERLLADTEAYTRMSEAAPAIAQRFDASSALTKILGLIERTSEKE